MTLPLLSRTSDDSFCRHTPGTLDLVQIGAPAPGGIVRYQGGLVRARAGVTQAACVIAEGIEARLRLLPQCYSRFA